MEIQLFLSKEERFRPSLLDLALIDVHRVSQPAMFMRWFTSAPRGKTR